MKRAPITRQRSPWVEGEPFGLCRQYERRCGACCKCVGEPPVSVVLRTLTFPAPARLLSLNDRMHWAAKGRDVKTWRTATYVHSLILFRPGPYGPFLEPATVDIALPVRTAHKRDPHNYMPTCKAIIDGLVDAGWWPDDNSDWISVMEPVLVVGGGLVTITARTRP